MGLPKRETSKVGKRGVVVIPAAMRRRFGIEEGATVIAEEREDGILIRPAVTLPVEQYSDERIAEFLLNNSMPGEDHEQARTKVRAMGLDPDAILQDDPDEV